MRHSVVLFAAVLSAVTAAGCAQSPAYFPSGGDDAGEPGGAIDLSVPAGGPYDLAGADLSPPVFTGTVGNAGGTVNRLFFGFTGDTRPTDCDTPDLYPTAIITSIFRRMAAAGVQFAADLGDHMFVCNGNQAEADTMMGYYMGATGELGGRPVFMTLGNHECATSKICTVGGYQNANFRAYMKRLAPISTQPYYAIDIHTDAGLARLVFIGDNAWDANQQAWLMQTLADADQRATYTLVFRHHPLDNTDQAVYATITQVIRAHKRTLVFTGHTHEFKLDVGNDPSGRTLVIGTGGAPLQNGGWYGYGTVEQLPEGILRVRLYDQASGNPMGSFAVSPQ